MEVKREYYLNQLISHKHNGLIKIISGIRRCGKSYLLSELFRKHLLAEGVKEDHIIHIALDDYEKKQYRNPDNCYQYVKSSIKDDEMYYLLLDEVQMMDSFEDVLNGFLHIKNLDVYVTGSNSKFLSSDVVTEFRGRGDEIRVYPFSFAEFYSVIGGDWSDAWREYYTYGGMPLILSKKTDEEKAKYLQDLFKETYIRDIEERNKIKNNDELEELINVLASGIGCLTNPQKLVSTFNSVKHIGISLPTIKQYLDYLQDSFIINKVLRYDIKGKKVSDVELAEAIFGIEPNEAIVHSVLVNYLANQRQGTQSTKTRAEVRGGGRKPWRQKGTGRARQGSIRAPQWVKGGIALGPKPRSYKYTVNKKERRLAIRSVLSSKVLENNLVVLDKAEMKEIKTQAMVKTLANLKVEGKTLILLPERNENVQKSARNIKNVKTTLVNTINVYDLLKYNKLVVTLDAVKKLEEVYA